MTAAAVPVTMRPYQTAAIGAVFSAWKAGSRSVLIESATGTGKTSIVAQAIVDLLRDGVAGRAVRRILFMAHRQELIDQAAERFKSFGLEVGVERASQWSDGEAVVVASVQTLSASGGARLTSFPADAFDVIIVDECHHAPAVGYRSVFNHFPNALIFGVTATPDRADKIALSCVFDVCAFRYGIADAVRDGWLVPARAIRVEVPGMDLSKVRQKKIEVSTTGERAGTSIAVKTPEEGWVTDAAGHATANGAESRDFHVGDLARACIVPEAVDGVVGPLVELAEKRRTIVFAVDRAHAWAITKALRARGCTADMVDGVMKKKHRAAVFKAHQTGELQYLVNVMVATEGYDDPAIECVAIARPTQSRILFAQAVGRGLRLFAGKTECLVLDFVGVGCRFSLVGPEDVLAGALKEPVKVIKAASKSSPAKPLADGETKPGKSMSFSTKVVDIMRAGGRAVASAVTRVTSSKSWLGRMFFGD